MKIEAFAYNVASRTIQLMEELQHYKVSDEARKEIMARVVKEVPSLMKQG